VTVDTSQQTAINDECFH